MVDTFSSLTWIQGEGKARGQMCGRSCNAAPGHVLQAACARQPKCGSTASTPPSVPWRSHEEHERWRPRHNIAPTTEVPVMLMNGSTHQRTLGLMHWGLVPSWHRGTLKDLKLNMINARSDTILDKVSPHNYHPSTASTCAS